MKTKRLLLHGVIAESINILWWLVFDQFLQEDFALGEILGYSAMLVALSTVFIGIKEYRDNKLEGVISFKKAFLYGLKIVLIASFVYVIGWEAYYPIFQQDFSESYIQNLEKKYEDSDLTQVEIDTKINEAQTMMEDYKNPIYRMPITFLEIFPVGLLVTIIASLILMKKPDHLADEKTATP